MGAEVLSDDIPKKVDGEFFKRAPFTKPPFTLGELKKAIPPHCFQRSLLASFSYLIYDLAVVFSLYHLATTFIPQLPSPLRYVAWPAYWLAQGTIMTGVSQLGHECGHHGFSDYRWLDDAVGLMLHSSILIPYYSFKFTHARHHANTGSLGREESVATKRKDQLNKFGLWLFDMMNIPVFRIVIIVGTLFFGIHLYIGANVYGSRYHRFTSHFDPWSPMFTKGQRLQIILSDVIVAAFVYVYYHLGVTNGWSWFMCVIGAPFIVLNAFKVTHACLGHVHPSLPRYDVTKS